MRLGGNRRRTKESMIGPHELLRGTKAFGPADPVAPGRIYLGQPLGKV